MITEATSSLMITIIHESSSLMVGCKFGRLNIGLDTEFITGDEEKRGINHKVGSNRQING